MNSQFHLCLRRRKKGFSLSTKLNEKTNLFSIEGGNLHQMNHCGHFKPNYVVVGPQTMEPSKTPSSYAKTAQKKIRDFPSPSPFVHSIKKMIFILLTGGRGATLLFQARSQKNTFVDEV